MSADAVLAVEGVTVRYGGLVAVDDVSLDVLPGQITSLIGPNGAGKTSLFNAIAGIVEPDEGRIVLDGADVSGTTTSARARRGMGRTFQRLEVFAQMSVEEHLLVAAEAARPSNPLRELVRLQHHTDPPVREVVDEIVDRVGLGDVRHEVAGELSTGTLRLVEIARALATRPKVLLLDEPGSGLDDSETEAFEALLRSIAEDGVGVLLIEHDVALVMEVSAVVNVLDFGKLIASGPPDVVAADPVVRASYLGEESPAAAGPVGAS